MCILVHFSGVYIHVDIVLEEAWQGLFFSLLLFKIYQPDRVNLDAAGVLQSDILPLDGNSKTLKFDQTTKILD